MTQKTQRWQIWVIVGLPFLAMGLARLLFPTTENERDQLLDFLGTRNQGVLIETPTTIAEITLSTSDGTVWQASGENGKWKLVVVGDADCDNACRQSLYLTRQIHRLLPKRSTRLERLYIGSGDPSPALAKWLKQEYPGMTVLRDAGLGIDGLLDHAGVPSQRSGLFYLLDPRGYLVMYYTPEHDYKQVIKDLKVLL